MTLWHALGNRKVSVGALQGRAHGQSLVLSSFAVGHLVALSSSVLLKQCLLKDIDQISMCVCVYACVCACVCAWCMLYVHMSMHILMSGHTHWLDARG